MKIRCTRKRNHSRVYHNKFCSIVSCLPDVMGKGWKGFTDIRSCDQNDFCMLEIRPGVGGPIQPECFFVSSTGADHTQPSVVIEVGRLKCNPSKFSNHIALFIGQGNP